MPDLRQALRDFVATSNSGKYATEQELMSKFPELKGYDIQVLKDFVATSNSGKYATEEELFAKFPEFNQGTPVKKKFALESSSEVGSSELQKSPEQKQTFRLPTEKEFEEGQKRGEFVPNRAMPKSQETQYDLEGNTGKIIPKEKKTLPKLRTKEELKKEQEKGFYTKGEENIIRQEISKDFEEKGFTENAKQKFIDGNFFTKEKRVFAKDKELIKSDIDTQINEEDLNNPTPFKFYSTYDKQPEYNPATRTFIQTPKDTFVDTEFGDEKLRGIGIDPADFDGYLNEKGFKKDFLEKEEKGLFEGGGRNLGGADIQLAREIQKQKLLANYIAEKNNRNFKLNSLKAKKENLDRSSSNAIKVEKTTLFDPVKVESYLEQEFPLLTKKLKERDEESRRILEQHNKGEAGVWYGTKNFFKSGWNGFVDRINNLSATVYDKIGMDETAEEIRMMHEENQMLKPDTREVGYVSGKLAKYDGVEYIVDDNGQIYDKDKKIRVTDLFFKPEYDAIVNESKKGTRDWIFSPQGSAIQLGGVLGDMVVQVALTRGVGGATSSALGTELLSVSRLSKIPISKNISSAIIAQSSLGYSQGLEETMKAAKDAGLTTEEAEMLANDAAQRMGILYAVTAPIAPQTKATQALFGNAEKDLIKKAVLAYRETGKKGFVETFRNGIPKLAKAGTEMTEEGLKEVFQENIQQAGEMFLINKETNQKAAAQILKDSISVDEFINTSILSFAAAGLISQMKTPTLFKNNAVEQLRTLNTLGQDYTKFEQDLKNLVDNGVIDNNSAEKLKKDVRILSNNKSKIPTDTKPEFVMDLARGLEEISDLENKKKALDPSFHESIDEQIKSKREEIKNIYNKSKLSETDAIQEQSTTEIPVQSETGVSEKVEEGVSQPKPEVITEQGTQEEVTAPQTIIEAMQNPADVFVYDGKKGQLTTIGQTVVLETPTEIIDLGNVDELSDATLDELGLSKEEELNFTLNEDNSVEINGKKYVNNYSNPEAAINQDKDGNYSVTLETENGQKRTFRGQQADQIVYQMKLKNFEENGTEQQIDNAIELADEAIRVEEETREPSTEREGKTVRKGKRKQRTLKTVKEPLTKAERAEQEASALQDKIKLQELNESEEHNSKVKALTKGEPMGSFFDTYTKAKKDGSNPELVKAVDELLAIDYKAPKGTEGMLAIALAFEKARTKPSETKKSTIIEIPFRENKYGEKIIEKRGRELLNELIDDYLLKNNIPKKDVEENRTITPKELEEQNKKLENAKTGERIKVKALHGTRNVFDKLSKDFLGVFTNSKSAKKAFFLTTDSNTATTYANTSMSVSDYQKKIMNYLSEKTNLSFEDVFDFVRLNDKTRDNSFVLSADVELRNPLVVDNINNTKEEIDIDGTINYAISNGYDGVIFLNTPDAFATFREDLRGNHIAVFDENNVSDINVEKVFGSSTKTETAPAVEPTESVNDLLDVDTKEKSGLKRVVDFLDRIDESLKLDPNELNDVTRVMAVNTAKAIVKTLKALVNAGITLKEAIENVSDIYNITSDKIIDALDIVSKINENKSEGLSEMEVPGYNQLSKEIDNMIDNDSDVNEVLDYVKESDVYKNATDVQKELFVRDVRKRFGLRQKSAPSVGKLFGTIKDVKKITMREKDLLVKQLKDKAKGARESIQAWRQQSAELTKELADLVKAGKITNTQSASIIKRFSKVNIFSEKSVGRFVDYMTKVFNDSNYKQKLSDARKNLSSLKKLAKNKETNGNLRDIASQFVKIDPSLVSNIDAYNDIAQRLKVALKGSKTLGSDVKIADTIDINEVASYINDTLESQEETLKEEKLQEIKDLLGIDASTFTDEEIDALLESDENLSKDNGKIVRAKIKKAFDIYSSVIEEMLSTGVDPFTEEEVEFTKKQKDLIERFMSIDVNDIKDIKEALRAVDSLINFIQNKSTAGMLKSIANFEGVQGGKKSVSEGLIAKPLRKYFSKKLGLSLGQKVTALPVLFDKMFKGVTRALKVEEFIGLSDLINNASKAESETNNIVKKYVKQFYDKKANGEKFNTAYNDIERGVFAHVYRNVIGSESRAKKVFDKRKQEVLDAIDLLSEKGNDSEIKIAELLQKAYDKLLKDSKNIEEVKSKTDATNVKAVDFWINEWADRYEDLSDLSINFYNKVLGKELNYTPDKVRRLQDDTRDVDLEDIQSQFLANTDEILYDKKSGNLMDKQENRKIPKSMYIDFSFDKKNANAMNDALTDLYTAFDISKVGSFLRSDSFRKVFPSAKDARLVDNRIKKFVRLTRKKTPFSNDDISNIMKGADKLAKLGVTAALASPFQPFKQVVPVMFNTAASAGNIGLGIITNKGFNNWINNLGYAISNRGVESQAQIDSLNKLIEQAADMPLDKAMKFIENVNEKALKVLLVNPDIWVARASFKAYYEQSLKKQGLKSSGIDYNNHEVNKEAANYAQRMVDRQQNISNPNLAGDLFTSESKSSKAFIKMLMPFSSFRMNQASRLAADLTTLEYWNTSTREDKVIAMRSIAGYALEAATYRTLQIGISLAMYSAAKAFLGVGDDDEEDKKYLDNLIKGASQGLFVDTFSFLPLGDPIAQDLLAYSVDEVENLMGRSEEEKIKLFGSSEQSFLKLMGTYGIPLQKAKDLYTLGSLAYTRKYKDRFGNEKEIGQAEADKLKLLIAPLFTASVLGVASPDMTSLANKSIKISKNQKGPSKKFLKERYPERYKRVFGDDKKESSKTNRLKQREERIKQRRKRRFGSD